MPSQTSDGSKDNSREQLAEMKRDLGEMRALVHQLISANAVENVLMNGFTKLAAQLEPLADLADLAPPRRMQMGREERDRLSYIRAELQRQSWTGTKCFDPPDPPLPNCKNAADTTRLTKG